MTLHAFGGCCHLRARVVWADMLPKCVWHRGHDLKAIDLLRHKVNKQPAWHLLWLTLHLPFRWCHLFVEGWDIYLANMARGHMALIELFMGSSGPS